MHNNGFTKVPNAIIRSSVLSIAEKAVWCYIASMPDGYRYSVRSACMVLHIGDKKWRRAIIELEKLNADAGSFGLRTEREPHGFSVVFSAVRTRSVPAMRKERHLPLGGASRNGVESCAMARGQHFQDLCKRWPQRECRHVPDACGSAVASISSLRQPLAQSALPPPCRRPNGSSCTDCRRHRRMCSLFSAVQGAK